MSAELTPKFESLCRNLRSKEMFYDTGQENDQFSSGLFWCCKTQDGLGPDGQEVSKKECCKSRSCYVG